MQSPMTGDSLRTLPVSDVQPTHDELMVVENLFKSPGKDMKLVMFELKDTFLVGILFILFTTSYIDDLIYKVVPHVRNSKYTLFIIKMVGVMALYWLIKNFALGTK